MFGCASWAKDSLLGSTSYRDHLVIDALLQLLLLLLQLLLVLEQLLLVLLPEDLLAGFLDGFKDLRLGHDLFLHILDSRFRIDVDQIAETLREVLIVVGFLLDFVAFDEREWRIRGIRGALASTACGSR